MEFIITPPGFDKFTPDEPIRLNSFMSKNYTSPTESSSSESDSDETDLVMSESIEEKDISGENKINPSSEAEKILDLSATSDNLHPSNDISSPLETTGDISSPLVSHLVNPQEYKDIILDLKCLKTFKVPLISFIDASGVEYKFDYTILSTQEWSYILRLLMGGPIVCRYYVKDGIEKFDVYSHKFITREIVAEFIYRNVTMEFISSIYNELKDTSGEGTSPEQGYYHSKYTVFTDSRDPKIAITAVFFWESNHPGTLFCTGFKTRRSIDDCVAGSFYLGEKNVIYGSMKSNQKLKMDLVRDEGNDRYMHIDLNGLIKLGDKKIRELYPK